MNADMTTLIIIFASIIVSITLHEAMHAFVSHWLGDDTAQSQGRLTFNPIAHIDPFLTVLLPLMLALVGAPPFGAAKPVPFNPGRLRYGEYGVAMVGLAGPLTNLLLAVAAGAILRLAGADLGSLADTLYIFAYVNVTFFVFNMIPFPPLDGSRVLYVFAPDSVREIMQRVEYMGMMAVLFFMMFFYLFLSVPFANIVVVVVHFLTGA